MFRFRPEHDVSRHVLPSSDRVDELMRYFEQRYRLTGIGKAVQIIAIAAACHHLTNIHPFPEGNLNR